MKRITLKEAEEIAIHYLNVILEPKLEMAIDSDETIAFDKGFIFTYDSKKCLVDGDFSFRITGIYPIIVDNLDGEVFDPNRDLYTEELISLFKKKKKYS